MSKKPVCLCKCGKDFPNRRELILHIGMHNISWPSSRTDDAHADAKIVFKTTQPSRKKRKGWRS